MAGLLMRRMPPKEIANHFGRVLRTCDEFRAKTPAGLVNMNDRVSAVASQLVAAIDSDFIMVIHSEGGKWGESEPDPAGPPRWYEGYQDGAHDGSARRPGFSGP